MRRTGGPQIPRAKRLGTTGKTWRVANPKRKVFLRRNGHIVFRGLHFWPAPEFM